MMGKTPPASPPMPETSHGGNQGETRCGFIAVLGAPNAGKSTLVNQAVGTKVSIVSPKVQTTRSRVIGIALHGAAQIVFVDTPGIFAPRRRLDRAMVAAAWGGAADADEILLVVDGIRMARNNFQMDPETAAIVAELQRQKRTVSVVLNKIDGVPRPSLLRMAALFDESGVAGNIFMISALEGDGIGDLVAEMARRLPPGPWLYPVDQVSDMPARLLAAEITREQIFHRLRQELPYGVLVESESWQERDDGSVRIDQVIYIARESHKAILLGKGGRQIKEIGAAARRELEEMLERRVHLFLHVKYRGNWADDPARYRAMGLDFSD